MRIALVEDSSVDQKRMKEVLDALSKELSFSYTLSTFANGFDFMESYKPVYDLVLMDIEMAKMNGLETAERLRKVDPNVLLIFITNMAQYALKGYQYQALDYVLKPVKEADMKMRGPGDLEGTQQSGLPVSLNIASIAKDSLLLSQARAYAEQLLEDDPALEKASNALLLKELRKDKYNIKDYSKIS